MHGDQSGEFVGGYWALIEEYIKTNIFVAYSWQCTEHNKALSSKAHSYHSLCVLQTTKQTYMLQVKIISSWKLLNLGWFSLSFVF